MGTNCGSAVRGGSADLAYRGCPDSLPHLLPWYGRCTPGFPAPPLPLSGYACRRRQGKESWAPHSAAVGPIHQTALKHQTTKLLSGHISNQHFNKTTVGSVHLLSLCIHFQYAAQNIQHRAFQRALFIDLNYILLFSPCCVPKWRSSPNWVQFGQKEFVSS